MKPPLKAEVLNDINSDIVNLYHVIQHHLEEFIKQFKWVLTSREIFDWLKDTPPETLTNIQQAARFYCLQKLLFGAKAESRTFCTSATGPSKLNLLRIEESLSEAWLRLHRVPIEHVGWKTCITRYGRFGTLLSGEVDYPC